MTIKLSRAAIEYEPKGDPGVKHHDHIGRLLLYNNLNMNIPSRGSKEERIRILLRVWANVIYRVTDIINKTEISKYV